MDTIVKTKRSVLALGGGAALLALALFWACSSTGSRASVREDRAMVLQAIRFVESGGLDNCPDGDGGRAIGPFQIHEVYWRDAVQADPSLGPDQGYGYQDCRERNYAEAIIEAYMQRYVPDAWTSVDAEVIARTHNGGPEGASKSATLSYWHRVEDVLQARGRTTG